MPEYLAPGVYVEEVSSGNKPIQAASTSTAGMVGATVRGPVNKPTLITTLGEFNRVFGGKLDPTDFAGKDALPHAVEGFFNNGGSRVYVTRVIGSASKRSSKDLLDAEDAKIAEVHAVHPGAWGDSLSFKIVSKNVLETKVAADIAEVPADEIGLLSLESVYAIEPGTLLTVGEDKNVLVTSVDKVESTVLFSGGLAGGASAVDGETPADSVKSVEFDLIIQRSENDKVVETERFDDLAFGASHSRYAPNVIGSMSSTGVPSKSGESNLVRLKAFTADTPFSLALEVEDPDDDAAPVADFVALASGDDNVAGITDASYKGTASDDPDLRTGIQAMINESDISIVAVPGQTSVTVQKALLAHCELMRYRFAVLDADKGAKLDGAKSHRQNFDSSFGAFYYPWLVIADPFGQKGDETAIPPSGHVLGIYARTDVQRGVHKAPANEVVKSILSFEQKINKGLQDVLNPIGVNCFRDFRDANRGLRLYGARTLSSNPEWRYVNVRRLFLFLEKSVDNAMQWAVFEPNAEPLWATVKRSLVNFLSTVHRSGALEGTTQDEAFYVNIGRDTMSQADIDNGKLIVEIGVAPVKPAEFVIFRFTQKTREAQG